MVPSYLSRSAFAGHQMAILQTQSSAWQRSRLGSGGWKPRNAWNIRNIRTLIPSRHVLCWRNRACKWQPLRSHQSEFHCSQACQASCDQNVKLLAVHGILHFIQTLPGELFCSWRRGMPCTLHLKNFQRWHVHLCICWRRSCSLDWTSKTRPLACTENTGMMCDRHILALHMQTRMGISATHPSPLRCNDSHRISCCHEPSEQEAFRHVFDDLLAKREAVVCNFCVCGFARSCMDLLQEVRMAAERLGALEEHEPVVGRECPTVALFLWQIVTSSKQDGFHHALCAPKSKSQEDRHELTCHVSKEAAKLQMILRCFYLSQGASEIYLQWHRMRAGLGWKK